MEGGKLLLRGLYCREDSSDYITGSISGAPEEAETLGIALANQLLGEYHGR